MKLSTVHTNAMAFPVEDPDRFSDAKISHALRLPFHPALTKTAMRLDKFEDLPVDTLRRYYSGLIIDVNGTLVEPEEDDLSQPVLEKLKEIRDKMPVCIFGRQLPAFYGLHIPVVKNVPAKPSKAGFDIAVYRYLQSKNRSRGLVYPDECAMVGDDFLTDGGCRQLNMKFVYVKSRNSHQGLVPRINRRIAETIAGIHDRWRRKPTLELTR